MGLTQRDSSVILRFSGRETAAFDVAILCCGHEPSEGLAAPFVSLWAEPSSWNAAPDSTILILGTGLTMVDAAISLSECGHRGPIVALSRRGLLPQAHRRVDCVAIAETELPSPAKLALFLRWLRARAPDEIKSGGDWRSVIDGLRPHTGDLARHAKWVPPKVPRTRAPLVGHSPPSNGAAGRNEDPSAAWEGQLRVLAGRILEVNRRERIDSSARLRYSVPARGLPDRLLPRVDERSTAGRQSSRRPTPRRGLRARRSAGHRPRRRQRLRGDRRQRARFGPCLRDRSDEPSRLLGGDCGPGHSPPGGVACPAPDRARLSAKATGSARSRSPSAWSTRWREL
jgi:hypothetical protein